MNLREKTILVTGGTGSFGKAFIKLVQSRGGCKKLIVFSRDEYKQHLMQLEEPCFQENNMRYFLGCIRDKSRLDRALDGVDIVVHAAALKQVPSAEYNPTEYIKTNVLGAMNLIDAAIDKKVQKVIALSTDKAVAPINLYGATKLCADKLFVAGNSYSGFHETSFSVVRYGNVLASRGSIVDKFQELKKAQEKCFPITDLSMTRFWIEIEKAADFVYQVLHEENPGGKIFIPKMPSMKITDLALAIDENAQFQEIGIRPGEKMHEVLLTKDDARYALEFDNHFVILPQIFKGKPIDLKSMEQYKNRVRDDFSYTSNQNPAQLSVQALQKILGIELSSTKTKVR